MVMAKRPPLAFSVAEMSVAEMSGPKRPRLKCPRPKCPAFVGTASWQNHDSSSPRSLLLYCTAMFVQVYKTPTFPPHCRDNVKVKTQHIYQAMDIPVLLRGWGEAAVTNDWCIIYSL